MRGSLPRITNLSWSSSSVNILRNNLASLSCISSDQPTSSRLNFINWDPNFRLGLCEGDCDSDSDCATGLKCFQRNTNGPTPPGCAGTPSSNADYCIQDTNYRKEYFDFYPKMDSGGNDIGRISGGVGVYAEECYKDPACKGFNSNGWMKFRVKERSQWSQWTNDPSLGFYVKKE